MKGLSARLLLKSAVLLVLLVVGLAKAKEEDYYTVLGLSKDCSDREVTRAYRKQALKWHPDKNRDDPKRAEKRFKLVSEAYEVLHDAEKRKMYDLYGKEGVFASAGAGGGPGGAGGGWPGQGFPGQGGMPNFAGAQGGPGGASFFSFGGGDGGGGGGASGGSFGGFTDPRELFEGFFGGGGGLDDFGDGGAASLFGGLFGPPSFDDPSGVGSKRKGGFHGGPGQGRSRPRQRPRPRQSGPPVEKEFWCSLRELYEGCEKKLRVTDTVSDPFTGQSRKVSHVYRIAVKPGWKEGTRVTFPAKREGLRSICFVLRQKRHRYLRREGDCLVYDCRLTDDQARRGVRISVPLLSKADPPVELTTKGQEVYHNKEMLLPGLGMPTKSGGGGGGGDRGAFKIKFLLQQRSGKAASAA
ncbi:unnamed protein product [Ectocarpus sp. 6 AP-2014]